MKNVLIIDDDVSLAESLRINLEATGAYTVRVENRSALALSTARVFHPDIILLDYIMPGQDGGDVSARLHEDPGLKDVPIIMVTALISNSETGDAGIAKRGNTLMMAKPIRLAKLIENMESLLARRAAVAS